jgi:hypothetical protein
LPSQIPGASFSSRQFLLLTRPAMSSLSRRAHVDGPIH